VRAAREQANRDTELNRLKAQLKSLREMLRESHKVLKGRRPYSFPYPYPYPYPLHP